MPQAQQFPTENGASRLARRLVFGLTLSGLFLPGAGCYQNWGEIDASPTPTATPAPQHFELEPLNPPVVTWNTSNGKTRVLTQLIVRDETGVPIDPSSLRSTLLLDGNAIDPESLLTSDSTDLTFDILFGLVLDGSYSMLVQDPPAFHPMLEAAADSVDTGATLWAEDGGSFYWDMAWFNETVCSPTQTWKIPDILTVPEPLPGTATRLFGAVSAMAERMHLKWQSGIASRPIDYHVMLVLSDGADNISWFNNSTLYNTASTSSGAPYACTGTLDTSLEDAVASIETHANLTVHVAGLGSEINNLELQQLATAGEGLYLVNPSSNAVSDLFERITQEFYSIRVEGAEMPLPPGDYVFTVKVEGMAPRGSGVISFLLHAGDSDAGVLSE